MSAWVQVFTLDLAVIALAGVVLLADAFLSLPGRALGWLVTAFLLFVLGEIGRAHV